MTGPLYVVLPDGVHVGFLDGRRFQTRGGRLMQWVRMKGSPRGRWISDARIYADQAAAARARRAELAHRAKRSRSQ